jgi:hypothetical protein
MSADTRKRFQNLKRKEVIPVVLLASDYDKSRFLKADDLEGERKFRIKAATEEAVGTGANKEKKLVVWFTNDDRGLVLNKTNNRVLRGAFGDNTAGWAGKIIVAFSTMVEMGGKMVQGLRVRIPPPKQAGSTTRTMTAGKEYSGKGSAAVTPPAAAKSKPSAAKKPPVQDDELDSDVETPPQPEADFDDEIPY